METERRKERRKVGCLAEEGRKGGKKRQKEEMEETKGRERGEGKEKQAKRKMTDKGEFMPQTFPSLTQGLRK